MRRWGDEGGRIQNTEYRRQEAGAGGRSLKLRAAQLVKLFRLHSTRVYEFRLDH
jgi:hypothetical protein